MVREEAIANLEKLISLFEIASEQNKMMMCFNLSLKTK